MQFNKYKVDHGLMTDQEAFEDLEKYIEIMKRNDNVGPVISTEAAGGTISEDDIHAMMQANIDFRPVGQSDEDWYETQKWYLEQDNRNQSSFWRNYLQEWKERGHKW